MATLNSLYRLFWVVEVTLYALIRLFFTVSARGWSGKLVASHARQWASTLVRGLDIRISLEGRIPGHGALVVSNHRSYLDIVVILSHMDAAFLAKAELRSWPVFGYAAQKGNTVFVDRSDAQSRSKARQDLADRICQDISVVVFPEGTTFKGPGLLPFKNGIFHMAAERDIPVVPVSITYGNPDAAWVGDDFFVPHFLRIFKTSPLNATLTFGPVLRDRDGNALKQKAYDNIACQLASRETGLPN
ncbi:MAG: lysophospholipid acyltransferase family protein [Desulfobacter sp.]